MIPYDFEYYNPSSVEEAVQLFQTLHHDGKEPMYFSGGTEIITFGRLNMVRAGAVIDIKNIPECRALEFNQESLFIGAANALTTIEERNPFPLLSQTVSEIADRTARNKITVGGNICGTIFYREAVLPFLLTDSLVLVAGHRGLRSVPINEIFQEQLLLESGELLVQMVTNRAYLEQPFVSIKRRRQWDTGYPLITVAALKVGQEIRVAISGLTDFPFRAKQIEGALNRRDLSDEQRIELALHSLDVLILNDTEGSSQYRLFVLKNTLHDVLHELGG